MQTRLQGYRYSSKVAGVMDKVGVPNWILNYGLPNAKYGLGFQLVNPQNLISIEQLVTHFRASTITAGATIIAIEVADADVNPFTAVNRLVVNIPQVSGIIDFSKALTPLLLPTKNNVVNLIFDRNTTLTIESWKNDMLYTAQGLK